MATFYHNITKIDYIKEVVLPALKPRQRETLALMRDGWLMVSERVPGKILNYMLKDAEQRPMPAQLPGELIELHSETKKRGPEDRAGRRKIYTTYTMRLSSAAQQVFSCDATAAS